MKVYSLVVVLGTLVSVDAIFFGIDIGIGGGLLAGAASTAALLSGAAALTGLGVLLGKAKANAGFGFDAFDVKGKFNGPMMPMQPVYGGGYGHRGGYNGGFTGYSDGFSDYRVSWSSNRGKIPK